MISTNGWTGNYGHSEVTMRRPRLGVIAKPVLITLVIQLVIVYAWAADRSHSKRIIATPTALITPTVPQEPAK